MTHQQEYDFLRFVHTTRSGDQQLLIPEYQDAYKHATLARFIVKRNTTGAYYLTDSGLQRYLYLQDLLEQQAQQEQERRQALRLERKHRRKESGRSWVQWFLSGLFSLFCVFLGAFLTLSTSWFNWLQSLIP